MKRIIDGVAYNTDTSTKIAQSDYETFYNHEARGCSATLYQTRGGAYFVHEHIHVGVDHDLGEAYRDRFLACSADKAHEWIMTGEVEIFHNPFADPPEAVAESESGATIFVRVPSSLKHRVEEASKSTKLSGNAWMTRCVEECLDENTIHDLPELAYIYTIAGTFSAFSDGEWSREKMIEGFDQIHNFVTELAEKLLGKKALDDVGFTFDGDGTWESLNKTFAPYNE